MVTVVPDGPAGGREAALQALANDTMIYFRSEAQNRFNDKNGGHAATQYHRWVNESGSYEVQVFGPYEPWTIVHRSDFTPG